MIDEAEVARMLAAARRAQRAAYAPYSKFRVGAAILTAHGRIIPGCNVENASYGLSICAERNAMCRIVAEGAGTPLACLVVGPTEAPLTPCGACRQFLLEFNPRMPIICIGIRDARRDYVLSDLLAASFGSEALV